MSDVTQEGERLITAWRDAVECLRRANSHLTQQALLLAEAERELGKWLVPGDIENGEKICVWYGDSLIQAVRNVDGTFLISIRKRGKSTL